ncbi:MAG: AbrB/MazE/SpoVT family DNA-binding domain-containing protein [Patescibacteria group bacterium]
MPSHTITRKFTSKGQITIPVEIRNYLASDYVVFEIRNGEVFIKPVEMNFEEALGSVDTPKHIGGMTNKEMRQVISDDVADNFKNSDKLIK